MLDEASCCSDNVDVIFIALFYRHIFPSEAPQGLTLENTIVFLLICQERIDLVSKGSVPVLYGLSSDEDITTLHYVACTLVRLGTEEQGHARMIQEGAAR